MIDKSDRKFFYVFFICILGFLVASVLRGVPTQDAPITAILPCLAVMIVMTGCVVGIAALQRYQAVLGKIGRKMRLGGLVLFFCSRIVNHFLHGGSVFSTYVVVGVCAVALVICTVILLMIEDYR